MSPLREIRLLKRIVGRVLWTIAVHLNLVLDAAIVREAMIAGMTLRLPRPLDQIVEIAAHAYLSVSNLVGQIGHGHGRVIGVAHDVLAQRIKTVVYVPRVDLRSVSSLKIGVRFAHCFLRRRVSELRHSEAGSATYEAMQPVEDFEKVHAFGLVPREAEDRQWEVVLRCPLVSQRHLQRARVDVVPELVRK
jgi:hypothetical protein